MKTNYNNAFLSGLMENPELVRNVAIVGHLHHGKTLVSLRHCLLNCAIWRMFARLPCLLLLHSVATAIDRFARGCLCSCALHANCLHAAHVPVLTAVSKYDGSRNMYQHQDIGPEVQCSTTSSEISRMKLPPFHTVQPYTHEKLKHDMSGLSSYMLAIS